jgi:anaerobic selenocysteine-containing dehydrogenase
MGLQLVVKPVSFSGTVRVKGHPLDMNEQPTTDELFEMVTHGSRIPLEEVKRHPAGAIFPDPPMRVAARDPGWEGRLDLGNDVMMSDLTGLAMDLDEPRADEWPFHLVSRRQMNVLNSVGCDEPGQTGGRTTNPAYMHPDDLATLGLSPGDVVEIRSARASIPGIVEIDPHLRRGLVSMTHSWGDRPERDPDVRSIGANTGRLSAVDQDYERYTGLPRMSNIPVSVERA